MTAVTTLFHMPSSVSRVISRLLGAFLQGASAVTTRGCQRDVYPPNRLSPKEKPRDTARVFHGLEHLHLNMEFKAGTRAGIAVQLAAKLSQKASSSRSTNFCCNYPLGVSAR